MLIHPPTRWARPKRLRPPGFIVPCQPILARAVPAGDGWLHELKHDGFRIITYKDGERVWLWSRNGRDWSAEFVAITAAVRALPFSRIMLDGEVGALPRGPSRLSQAHVAGRPVNGVSLRLRSHLARGSGSARRRADRPAPHAAEGAQESRAGVALLRAYVRRRRRGDVPPRLRDGPRRHHLKARRLALQVGRVPRLGEDQEPGI